MRKALTETDSKGTEVIRGDQRGGPSRAGRAIKAKGAKEKAKYPKEGGHSRQVTS